MYPSAFCCGVIEGTHAAPPPGVCIPAAGVRGDAVVQLAREAAPTPAGVCLGVTDPLPLYPPKSGTGVARAVADGVLATGVPGTHGSCWLGVLGTAEWPRAP